MSEDPGAVLITGCSSGIGRETATRPGGEGWTVYATARNLDSIADLADAGCETLALDVTDEARWGRRSRRSRQRTAPSERWSTTPATASRGRWRRCRWRGSERSSRPTSSGSLRMCQLALPKMRAAGRGRIVNLSSMGGRLVFPGGGAYHATKYAVEALSDALRFEVRGFGVRVVDHRARPDHDPVRRDRCRLPCRNPRTGRRGRRRSLRGVQRRGRRRDARRLRGPDGEARRRPGHGRPGDRAGDLDAQPEAALQGHRLGPAGDRPAAAVQRSRLGRDDAQPVPEPAERAGSSDASRSACGEPRRVRSRR